MLSLQSHSVCVSCVKGAYTNGVVCTYIVGPCVVYCVLPWQHINEMDSCGTSVNRDYRGYWHQSSPGVSAMNI